MLNFVLTRHIVVESEFLLEWSLFREGMQVIFILSVIAKNVSINYDSL